MHIPTEVLYYIFNYLVPHGKILVGHDDFSDILSVRATCRAFRVISSKLKFWYDEDFCFSQLIPRRFNSLGKFEALEHESRARGLLNCLNADQVLMETIGRKTAWSFRTVPNLVAVAQSIPSFQLHITSLDYESYGAEFLSEATCPLPSINFGFTYLAWCPNMTTLLISDDNGDVSLDLIASSCPSLKKLEFYCNFGYSGSLRGLYGLEELVVWDYRLDANSSTRQGLLPIDSASSLKNLNLSYVYGPSENIYYSKFVSAFTNLSSYAVLPLCDNFCNSLIRANFTHLRTFATTIRIESDISVDKIIKILMSRTLGSLQTLRFLIEPFSWEFNACYLNIVRAITSQLSATLEELQLTLGMNTSWCEHLSSLHKLKDITWIAVDQEYCDSDNPLQLPLEGDDEETSRAEMVAIIAQNMMDAFQGFEQQPSISIQILDQQNYDQWDWC